MDGYYDYGPLVDLARPVVLVSPLADYTRAVGHRTSALLGLPYHDVDRLVEHEIGQDLRRLIHFQGPRAFLDVMLRRLGRAVTERPPGIVALGVGGLPRQGREHVDAHADLVTLDLDAANLYWRIQALCREREQEAWSPLFAGLPGCPGDLGPYLEEHREGLAGATLRIDANALGVAQATERVERWIERHSRRDDAAAAEPPASLR